VTEMDYTLEPLLVPDVQKVSRETVEYLCREAYAATGDDHERLLAVVAFNTLPFGFKWATHRTEWLRRLRRWHIWRPPLIQWIPQHPNCRCSVVFPSDENGPLNA
jgi:hypothetical protein